MSLWPDCRDRGHHIRCGEERPRRHLAGKNAISALLALLKSLPLADCGSTAAIRAMSTLFPYLEACGRALGIAQADGPRARSP